MDELKMVPVNIFFPRSASIYFHLKQKQSLKWFKVASFFVWGRESKEGYRALNPLTVHEEDER